MSFGRDAYLVRNSADLNVFVGSAAKELFLCTDQKVLALCNEKGVDALLLDEDMIPEDHRRMNLWAFEMAVTFTERSFADRKEQVYFESNFLLMQRLFIQVLKYRLVLKKILNDRDIRTIHMQENEASLLRMVWGLYLEYSNPSTKLHVHALKGEAAVNKSRMVKQTILAPIIKMADRYNRSVLKRISRQKGRTVLASGGINHLSAVLERLQQKHGMQIVYIENDFNLEKFIYCLRNKMIYLVLPPAERGHDVRETSLEFSAGQADYGLEDHSALLAGVLKMFFSQNRNFFNYDYDVLTALLSDHHFDALLLDEDMAMRRMIGVMAPDKCFVLSHGIPGAPLDSHVEKLRCRYRSGTTFVSGEFEKLEYEKLYYDPDRIVVSGIPRYDRLARPNKMPSLRSYRKKVLYCGAGMKTYSFESMYSVLGLKNYLGDFTDGYLQDLISVLSDRDDLSLGIKPHYHEEMDWKRSIRKQAAGRLRVKLFSHKADTFALETDADLIVTVESSVICEGIMLSKPVIVLNYGKNDLLADYARYPLIEEVRSKEQLRASIQRCLFDKNYLNDLAVRRDRFIEHYCYRMDGRNTERVADVIAKVPATQTASSGRLAHV